MPYITDLKKIKFHKDRYNLFVEKEFLCMIPDYLVNEYQLKKGVDVPRDILDTIFYESEKFRAHESAYRYLTIRPHSKFEIIVKLRKKGFDNKIIGAVIEKCLKEGYLDDAKFAEAWIRHRLSSKPRGRRMLQAELYKKGIEREIAEEVLSRMLAETSEEDLALQLLEKNRSRFLAQNSVDLKLKIRNFLSYRGFGYQSARTAADKFIESLENEDYDLNEEF